MASKNKEKPEVPVKKYKSDLEIAHSVEPRPITEIAAELGIKEKDLFYYGKKVAKVDYRMLKELSDKPDGKLILVTAITPTPMGEGKSTISVGLGQGLKKIGKKVVIALREPSLGPCMGIKGGATGGGYSQVLPMEEINLHFTGDIHAVSATNNLLAAVVDNHIHSGNKLNLDSRRVFWRRVVDMNDRALRDIVIGLGGRTEGVPRQDGFDITAASEVMAILCLSQDVSDLKRRLGNIVVGYTYDNKAVTCAQLKVHGAMAALLKDAINPNLAQSLEGVPAFIHGGPFANIAHGCNTVIATKMALKLGDYVVTEAGFGADLGAEKFFDIKCRQAGLKPDLAVLVVTLRAVKHQGGVKVADIRQRNFTAIMYGMENVKKHVSNIAQFGVPCQVVINRFVDDDPEELEILENMCSELDIKSVSSTAWSDGGAGGEDMAKAAVELIEKDGTKFKPLYPLDMSIHDKILTIASKIYGAKNIEYTRPARRNMKTLLDNKLSDLPICIAKTQNSISDDPTLKGAPSGYTVIVQGMRVSAGAGFIVVYLGDIMTMPGLPKTPAAENIDIDDDLKISGLF